MIKRVLILLLLFSTYCYADNVTNRDEAVGKAKEAFLRQSGAYDYGQKAGNYLLYTYHIEKPVAIGAYVFRTVRDKKLVFPVYDTKVTVKSNELQISFKI